MEILRNRSLVIIGVAESVSGIGNWVTMLAVFAIVVFRGEGTVAQSSGIFLAGLLPTLLSSPLAGWLCDRLDRKWLMIGSELLDGLAVAGLIFTQRLELIYGLLALQAVVMSVMAPARQAVIPDIVTPEALTRANAFLQQLGGLIKIAGPMLAGLILAAVSPHTAIVADVVSFLLSALILSRLPALPPKRNEGGHLRQGMKPADPQGKLSEASTPESDGTRTEREERSDNPNRLGQGQREDGALAVLRSSPGLQLLFVGMFLMIVVIVGFDVLSSIVTRDILQGDERLLGLLVGLVGLGTAAAALFLIVDKRQREPWHDVVAGWALMACLPGASALAAVLGDPGAARLALAAGCLLGGIGDGLAVVQAGTLLQRLAPPAVLGRMGGLWQSSATAGQLAGIVITPLLVPQVLTTARYFAVTTAALGLLVLMMLRAVRGEHSRPVPVDG